MLEALARPVVEEDVATADELQLLRAVIDGISDGVYVVTSGHRIVLWNRAAERITGYSAEEVVGRACGDQLLRHVDDEGRVVCGRACPLHQVRSGESADDSRVLYCLHRDGRRVPVRVHAAPLVSARGTVVGAVEVFRDDSEERQLRALMGELLEEARTDALTGLANRRRFEEALDVALYSHDRYQHPFALALFDLDHFKSINDAHGHDAGDTVLRIVGRTLSGLLRKADLAARWGGEEFALLLPGIGDDATLHAVSDRLRRLLGRVRVPYRGALILPTCSGGATPARVGDDTASILRRADAALYRSKREGRDRITIA